MFDIARHMTLKEVKRLMRDANDHASDVQRQLDDTRIQYALVMAGPRPDQPATPRDIIEALDSAGLEIVRKHRPADQDTA